MAITPKSSWPWVRTLLHSVFDQPDAESVAAQYDRIIDALADKLPKVADHLEHARADLLAFTAFPKQIWRQIWFEQPPGTAQQRDPASNRCRRDLPRPRRPDPPRRRSPGRATRRMGRITPLPRPRRPQQIPAHHRHPHRTGGHPRSTNRITQEVEESHDDVVHHVPGLDHVIADNLIEGLSCHPAPGAPVVTDTIIRHLNAGDGPFLPFGSANGAPAWRTSHRSTASHSARRIAPAHPACEVQTSNSRGSEAPGLTASRAVISHPDLYREGSATSVRGHRRLYSGSAMFIA